MPRKPSKTDANQSEIVALYRSIGAAITFTHELKNAFDLIISYKGRHYPTEVKDGAKFPNYFWKLNEEKKQEFLVKQLTDGERECMDRYRSVGAPYNIVYDKISALKAIGYDLPNTRKIKNSKG